MLDLHYYYYRDKTFSTVQFFMLWPKVLDGIGHDPKRLNHLKWTSQSQLIYYCFPCNAVPAPKLLDPDQSLNFRLYVCRTESENQRSLLK